MMGLKKAEAKSLTESKGSESSGESVEESDEPSIDKGIEVSFKKTSVSIRGALKSSPPKPPAAPFLFTNETFDQTLGYYKATYPESNTLGISHSAVEALSSIYSSATNRIS